jgi:EmrB/QacA subfamily drug resistance transporter
MMQNLNNDRLLKRIVLIVTTLAAFLAPFMGSALNVALPIIGKEFGLNAISLSWVQTSYLLSASILLIPFGRLSDMYGRKKIFQFGIIVFSIASILNAFSWSGISLICFRFFLGIGAAMIFSSNIALLTSVFPSSERGKVLGINVASTYTGLSIGPVLGGIMTQYMSWKSIFYLNFFVGIIISVIVTKLKNDRVNIKAEKFDIIGAIQYSIIIVCIIFGLSTIPQYYSWSLFAVAGLGVLSFIKWESKTEYPLFNIMIFRGNRVFAFSNLAALFNYSATFAVGYLLSLYLHYIKNFDPKSTGFILLAQPVIMAMFSPIAGKLSDKIESRIIASVGMGITSAGLVLLTFLNNDTSNTYIISSMVILGFGFAMFSSPNTNSVMSSIEKKYYGIASSTLATMRLTGQIFSMGITTLIFSLSIGNALIIEKQFPEFLKSIIILFYIFTFLSFSGVFLSLARGKKREF